MPNPGPDMTNESTLDNAISAVSKEVLVNLAQTLCKENKSAKECFEGSLFVREDQIPYADSQDNSKASDATNSRPRLRGLHQRRKGSRCIQEYQYELLLSSG